MDEVHLVHEVSPSPWLMSRVNPLAPLNQHLVEESERKKQRIAMLRITASWIVAIMLVSALARALF